MSFVLKTLGAGVLFVLLAIGAAVADFALNNGRIFFGMVGQEDLTAACPSAVRRRSLFVAEERGTGDTRALSPLPRCEA
jgi:hypothetical protein